MNWYIVIKFFHIIAVIMFVGGIFARQLVRQYAKKADDIRLFAAYNQAAGQIESILVIPGSQATLLVIGLQSSNHWFNRIGSNPIYPTRQEI